MKSRHNVNCNPSHGEQRELFAKVCRHLKRGLSLALSIEIGYVVRDAVKWEVNTGRDASESDAEYMGRYWKRHGVM